MAKIDLQSVELTLTPTGHGSTIRAGGAEISRMVEGVTIRTSTTEGTRVELRIVMADCRVTGRGAILAPHPGSGELLEVAEIKFKNGDRWKAVTESQER